MRYLILFTFVFTSLAFPQNGLAQDDETAHPSFSEHTNGYLRVAVLMGHTFIPMGPSHDRLAVPSWGIDLEYWFNHKWGAGLHNDIEIETFLVEHEGHEEVLTREYPLVLTLDALYKPWKQLVLLVGPGWEFEPTEDFFLIRAGVENREMVEALGFRIDRLFVAVFMLGSALAALGGAMWAGYQTLISPALGAEMMIVVFIVVIIGGLGSIEGTLLGALLVGLVGNYVGFLAPKMALASNMILMMAILLWRPSGLRPAVR